MKAFASFGGPGQTDAYARGARGARRAVRRRLPDRTAAAVPRAALAVPVADARVTRTGERALGRVRRDPAGEGQGRARRVEGARGEEARVRCRPLRRRRGHVPPERLALRGPARHVPREARGDRPLHPRPRDRAGRRAARDHQAADRGRHERAPRRRSGVPDVPHQGSDDAGVLPRVGGARLRVHRHRGVRSPVRPEAVGARVRRVAAAGPHRRRRRRARQPDHLADRRAPDGEDVPRARAGAADLLHRRAPRGSASSPRRRSAPGCSVSRPPPTTAPTRLHLSWGRHDIWKGVDLTGSDDATVVWWDPDATGPDEVGRDGTGLYRYADEGARYLPGQVADEAGRPLRRRDVGAPCSPSSRPRTRRPATPRPPDNSSLATSRDTRLAARSLLASNLLAALARRRIAIYS